MALPATGAAITMGTVRNYFGLSGTISMSTLGAYIHHQSQLTLNYQQHLVVGRTLTQLAHTVKE